MTDTKIRIVRVALASSWALDVFLSVKKHRLKPGSLVTEAYAIIGRPLTPMSYAGVARRTTYGARGSGGYASGIPRRVYAAPVYGPPVYVRQCVRKW